MPFTPGSIFNRGFRRWLLVMAAALLPAAHSAETDPWQAALNLDYNTASAELARRHALDPADLRTATAYAASLLVRQPRTAANLGEARNLLAGVRRRSGPADADHRALALYLLARIEHDHESTPRLEAARAHYEELRRDHPGHPLADQAGVHLALLAGWQSPGVTPEQAAAQIAALLDTVTAPAARRELHHLLGFLHWHRRQDAAAALPHFLAGRAIGYETPYRNGEADLTIAGLATELGRDQLAAQHYLAFAEAYPRDARTQTVRRLAAEALARTAAAP